MPLISDVLSPVAVHTIGWTLLHSLWQGTLVALAGLLLFVLMGRSSARTRYRIGVCLLLLMLAASLATALLVYRAEVYAGASALAADTGAPTKSFYGTSGFWSGFQAWFDNSMPMIVTAWLMVALFMFLKFAGGILAGQHLRYHHTCEADEYWTTRLNTLARKIRVRCPVVLRESRIIRTPLTIGHLKPVILFPLGMLAQMPPAQVETLIVHELSHILRRDYLANLLQNLVDIFYFYHPGVRWISQQVRREREYCCDDLTVSVLGDRINYARALSRVGEDSLPATDVAMAASRNSFTLLSRIRRLFSMNTKRTRLIDGMIGFSVMSIFIIFLAGGFSISGRLFAAPADEPASKAAVKKDEDRSEKVEILLKRYKELSLRKAALTDAEKAEYNALTRRLAEFKQKKEAEKIAAVKAELKKLQEKQTLSREEEFQRLKYTQFLTQYEQKQKLLYLKARHEALETREKALSAKEQAELHAIQEKLKAVALEHKARQEALAEKEKEMQLAFKKAKEHEAALEAKELSLLETERAEQEAAMEAEAEAREEEEFHARREEYQALQQEYLQLEKLKQRDQEQEDALKQVTHRLQEHKARHQELLQKQAVLKSRIQELKSVKNPSAEENARLQGLLRELNKINQELSLY